MTPENRKIKVLIVDDSAIVRKVLSDAISSEADLEVVGTAPDPYIARDKILALQPDVLTLDIEMPRMNGLTFLRKVMQYHPLPVIIISSLGQASCHVAVEALNLGAVDVLAKPGGPYSVGELRATLGSKVRAAAASSPRRRIAATQPVTSETQSNSAAIARLNQATSIGVVAIGASTGGTEAIRTVLTRLPVDMPPIVITQHIPPVFSRAFARNLNDACSLEVREAEDGDALVPGRALVAPGNFHMLVRRASSGYRVQLKDGPQVCYQRPSVDVLFGSVSEAVGPDAIGVILTGMGADGAQGMVRMKRAGARTLAQDEASCVVFGMPREAIKAGAVDRIISLNDVAPAIVSELRASVPA